MPTITIALPSYVTELQAEPFERVTGASGQVAQTVSLTGGAGSIVVAATSADWCWRFTEHGASWRKTRYCAVAGDTAYGSLVDLDPGTLVAVVEPADPAWEADAAAALAAASNAVTSVGRIRLDAAGFPSLTAAIAAATAGAYVHVPAGVYASPTGVGSGPTVGADDVTIEFAPGAEVQVPTWSQAGIDCIGRSGVTIVGGVVRYTGARVTGGGGSYRGSNPLSSTAGVWINGDRCTVDGLRTINMPVGVYLSSWNGVSSQDRQGLGNTIRGTEHEGMDFGVLWTGQRTLRISDVYGHDDIDDSAGANPTHVLYGASSTGSFTSDDVVITDCVGRNMLYGHAYQVKWTTNSRITNCVARDSIGVLSLLGCTDFGFDASLVGAKETAISPQGWVILQDFTSARISGKINIVADSVGADHRAVHMAASDSELDVTLITRRKSAAAASTAEVRILGTRNKLTGTIRNASAYPAPAVQIGDSTNDSTGCEARDLRASGCSRLVDLYATAGSAVVRYTPELLSLTTGTVVSVQGGSPTYRAIAM